MQSSRSPARIPRQVCHLTQFHSRQLAYALLEQKGVLTLPGSAFGAPPERLALRLSVCDYKGAEALAACAEREISPDQVTEFAPRVVAAANTIAAFAERAGRA